MPNRAFSGASSFSLPDQKTAVFGAAVDFPHGDPAAGVGKGCFGDAKLPGPG